MKSKQFLLATSLRPGADRPPNPRLLSRDKSSRRRNKDLMAADYDNHIDEERTDAAMERESRQRMGSNTRRRRRHEAQIAHSKDRRRRAAEAVLSGAQRRDLARGNA